MWVNVLLLFVLRPLRDGSFGKISYNTWEKGLLRILLVMSAIQTLNAGGMMSQRTADYVTIPLYLLPTLAILTICITQQCFRKQGGYSRLRHLSVAWWWGQRRSRTQSGSQEEELRETVLRDMLSDMREPLIVDQLRNMH